MHRIVLLAVFFALGSFSFAQQPAQMKVATGPSEFKIGGAVTTPLTVTMEDLKKMPRKTVRVENAHAKRTEVYEGVPLSALLQKAGVPQGEQIRGAAMTSYVLVEAADDYHVIFSLAETRFQLSGFGSPGGGYDGRGTAGSGPRPVQTCCSPRKTSGALGQDG